VSVDEVETVVKNNASRRHRNDSYIVVGRGTGGRWVQVVFVVDPDGTIYPIHARPLNEREKRRERRK
jgi:uncharacterized DUF497 family protein